MLTPATQYKFKLESKDNMHARMMEMEQREDDFIDQYNRRMTNELNEIKGDKALRKAQKTELKSIFEGMKKQKIEYKKAKFIPCRVPGGVKLTLNLKNVFTSDISVDSKTQRLVCKVEASPPKVPQEFEKYIGGDEMTTNKFEVCIISDEASH